MNIATRAIARSISHNEIVTIDTRDGYTEDDHDTLLAACEDHTDASETVREYWGTDDDGNTWRVHVRDC